MSLNINRVEETVYYIAMQYNNGWIQTEKQLPPEPEEGIEDMEDLPEYIVVIEGAEKPTVLQYAGNGEWYRERKFYRVSMWQPLPELIQGEKYQWNDGKKLHEIISKMGTKNND